VSAYVGSIQNLKDLKDFIEKEFHFKTLLVMKFTTQML